MWVIDVALNFIPYAGLPLVLAPLGALLVWRTRLAAIAGVPFLLWCVCMGGSNLLLARAAACSTAPALRVATVNVLGSNRQFPALSERVLAENADILVLEELPDRIETVLPVIAAAYPYQVATEMPWLTLASRIPIEDARQLDVPGVWAGKQLLAARLRFEGAPITVIAMHGVTPVSAADFAQRTAQFNRIAAEIEAVTEPVVVAGDINATIFSPVFASLLWRTGLRSATSQPVQRGTHFPFGQQLGLRIDHVLVRDMDVCREHVFSLSGSDHRGVSADIRPRSR